MQSLTFFIERRLSAPVRGIWIIRAHIRSALPICVAWTSTLLRTSSACCPLFESAPPAHMRVLGLCPPAPVFVAAARGSNAERSHSRDAYRVPAGARTWACCAINE
ncbi:MAG: hypothetical protein M0Q43_10415 [Methanothrix sp.]|nr:hypothetical protein [Methanothrix sp.]